MAVKLSSGGELGSSLTSPPEHPYPKPPPELIAKTVSYGDRDIIVTVPFPDSIVLITDVFNQHLKQPYATGKGAKWTYKEIDDDLKQWVQGFKTGDSYFDPAPKVIGGPKASAVFRIAYDENQPLNRARLSLSRVPGPDYGVWSARLEFSASKAGPSGLVKLMSRVDDALNLNFAALLATFRVSRIDPAIDLIGAEPLDVIAHVPNPGKRLVYIGDNGRPESMYLYEKKKPLEQPPQSMAYKTTGPLRLKLYERKAAFKQLLLTPPYGECPVTRIEYD